MKKREKGKLFTRIRVWRQNRKLRRAQARAKGAGQAVQSTAGVRAGVQRGPAATYKLAMGALCLILACSVISLTAVTVAKYTKEVTHTNNGLTVSGHTGTWTVTTPAVKNSSGGTLNGAYSPAIEQRTCTVCGTTESRYVFSNAIHNGDFGTTYTADNAYDIYTENRIVGSIVETISQPLTNWYGYNIEKHVTINLENTKDTETFYVGDETGALIIDKDSVGDPLSMTNRFILVEGFTYRIGFWYRYEGLVYSTTSNLLMRVNEYNNGTWTQVADLKVSDDEAQTPVFQMGVSEKDWTYASTTFTFADDGDATKLEQKIFDIYLQLYQIGIGKMVIDEFSCYPVTHIPENEKDEKFFTRYEVNRFNVPDFLLLNQNGSVNYVADGGETHVDRVTYSVAENGGYTLSADSKTLSFTQDGEYTVTAHFEADNTHGDHSHIKQASVTKRIKVRYAGSDVTVNYVSEDGSKVYTSSTLNGGMGQTDMPTFVLQKDGYRHDGWYYVEDGQMAYLHKQDTLLMKDYVVTLKAVFTELIYEEEVYGSILTDKQQGTYVNAYDFGNKEMWAGWANYSIVNFTHGDISDWNDDKITINYQNADGGVTSGSTHYHYAMELQRDVTYYFSGRIKADNVQIKNVGGTRFWVGITKYTSSAPDATPDNAITRLPQPSLGPGESLSGYDEYFTHTFTVPEDGMYYISFYLWGILSANVEFSQFSIRGAVGGQDSKINFSGASSLITTKVGNTVTLPYVSIPGKKIEGWQQQVPVRGTLTNTFIYPMGTKLLANIAGNNSIYVPYITKTYQYGSLQDSNNLLKDFGTMPTSEIYGKTPLGNAIAWDNFGSKPGLLTWDAAGKSATLNYNGELSSGSSYYNYPVYLVAGQEYVLKATISYDLLHYSTSDSCGVGLSVFGGRYIDGKFNTSGDNNYYNIESRISPIIGYDSGTYGNTITVAGQVLTNGRQDFSVTFIAPESKTYYVCFRMWGIIQAVNLKTSNVSLTPVNMQTPGSTYNYLGVTGSSTVDAGIVGAATGWTNAYNPFPAQGVTFDAGNNSITFKLTDYTYNGSAWSDWYGGGHWDKQVTLTKGTYQLSAKLDIRGMSLSATGGCEFGLYVSKSLDYANGNAANAGSIIPGSSIRYTTGTHTSNIAASSRGGSTKAIEPLYNATQKAYFSIPEDGTYSLYLQVWCPHYLDATITDIAITSCQTEDGSLSHVVDRVAGVSAWDFKWDNMGFGNMSGEWTTSNSNTDKIVLKAEEDNGAGVAAKRVYLEQGVRYKLSATFTVKDLVNRTSGGGGNVSVFLSDMAYGNAADLGADSFTNAITSTFLGYETKDSYVYDMEEWTVPVSSQKHSAYYVPERTGEFLLVLRFWNLSKIDAEVSDIRLNPVATEEMLPVTNFKDSWCTTNGAGLWQNTEWNEAAINYFPEVSAQLEITVAPNASQREYYYGAVYVMGSLPVYLKKGKTYRLSYTMELAAGQEFVLNQGSETSFAGIVLQDVMSGSSEKTEFLRLGYEEGTYTSTAYLQKDVNGNQLSFVGPENPVQLGVHSFSETFVASKTDTFYVCLNLWNLVCGRVIFRNISLVEV